MTSFPFRYGQFFTILPVASATALMVEFPSLAAAGQGDVLWTTQLDGKSNIQFLALAPDGTIYTNTRFATYAVDPKGQILWTSNAAPTDGVPHSISIGAEGTIYTGKGVVDDMYTVVVALNPDGSIKWQYIPPEHQFLTVGPNVGPDGNIYGLLEKWADNSNFAFSLNPNGILRWMTHGDLPVWATNEFVTTSDVEFGDDFMVAGHIKVDFTNPTLHAFSLDGQVLWGAASANPGTHTMPIVDPQNRTLCSWGQTGIQAISSEGNQQWFTLHPDGANLLQRPTVDSQGNIYVADFIGVDLWALNPDGSTRWVIPSTSEITSNIAVSPDDQFLIVAGNGGTDGPFWIRGYAAANGELLWQVDLPPLNVGDDLYWQFDTAYEPVFSDDSSIVYVTTSYAGENVSHSLLYAIQISDPQPIVGDISGDGVVDVTDLMNVINTWGACASCQICPSDLNGDCTVNVTDLLIVINNWG